MKVAVVGAGWAGLAAAVRATQAGHDVTVFDAAPMPGGRARSDGEGALSSDNGQHILLGGYTRTLALMRDVGVDIDAAFLRSPLAMTYLDGTGFALPRGGNRLFAAARALGSARGFTAIDKLSTVGMAILWQLQRFRCADALTVDEMLRRLPTPRVRAALIEPLCVAALNTPPAQASAAVFLRVLRDSLFGARAASDLLLPRVPLARLLPLPAVAWLRAHGATVHLRRRVLGLARDGAGWAVRCGAPADGAGGDQPSSPTGRFDRVILAATATEAARLAGAIAPEWAATAAALEHEPIVTLELRVPRRPWPSTMLTLASDATRHPAQFAFRLGHQDGELDRVTVVVSAAGDWLARGTDELVAAALAQWRTIFAVPPHEPVECLGVRADRRATFRCVAGVVRPPRHVAPGLLAAGDYVEGPYPATLEAAVLAGEAAAAALA